jgi:hypothetical protein
MNKKDEIYAYLCKEGKTSFFEVYEDGEYEPAIDFSTCERTNSAENVIILYTALQELWREGLIKIWWEEDIGDIYGSEYSQFFIYVDVLSAREIAHKVDF